ncbi:MAG: hypothetical protein PW791_03325 [Neorhizobium sp.]|nr:hypothetical protein [Neorhizobium sp.]
MTLLKINQVQGHEMFVVSVFDDGNERNFIASGIKVIGRILHAEIAGATKSFDLSDVVDILPVERMAEQPPARSGRRQSVDNVLNLLHTMKPRERLDA